MLMAYLLSTHKVGKTMNPYQLLRNALHFLGKRGQNDFQNLFWWLYMCINQLYLLFAFTCSASTDLTENGITLAKNPDSKAVSRSDSAKLLAHVSQFVSGLAYASCLSFSISPASASTAGVHAAFSCGICWTPLLGHLNLLARHDSIYATKRVKADRIMWFSRFHLLTSYVNLTMLLLVELK